jgi:hypothetical protein
LRVPLDIDEQEVSIQQLYTEIMESDFRNQQIIDDVLNNYHQGRNCIVLTLRTAHVESLAKKLKEKVPGVITLMGGMGRKATREIFQSIADIPADRNVILVATGHFIGEGFDEPRLDNSFFSHAYIMERHPAAICRAAPPIVRGKKRGQNLRLCGYPDKDAGKNVSEAAKRIRPDGI